MKFNLNFIFFRFKFKFCKFICINEKNKLEAEFQIINAVVTELSKQVEQAKLQVKKDTPVFSTIKEAIIPN